MSTPSVVADGRELRVGGTYEVRDSRKGTFVGRIFSVLDDGWVDVENADTGALVIVHAVPGRAYFVPIATEELS